MGNLRLAWAVVGLVASFAIIDTPAAKKVSEREVALAETQRLLQVQIPVTFKSVAPTVGQLVNEVLRGTGYELSSPSSEAERVFYNAPITSGGSLLAGRSIGFALKVIGGDLFRPMIDTRQFHVGYRPFVGSGAGGVLPANVAPVLSQYTIQGFPVRAGGLRYAVDALAKAYGWQLVGWDDTVVVNDQVVDWLVSVPFVIRAARLSEALQQLLAPYELQVVLYMQDRSVAVRIVRPGR